MRNHIKKSLIIAQLISGIVTMELEICAAISAYEYLLLDEISENIPPHLILLFLGVASGIISVILSLINFYLLHQNSVLTSELKKN